MTNFNCNCGCKHDCVFLAVLASIVVGLITFVLNFTGIIAATPAFLWVLFGIAVVVLALTPITTAIIRGSGVRGCICAILPALLAGLLGTILTSVILLAITFAVGSIIGAIILGALLGFFSLIVTAIACLTKCAAGCPGISEN